MVKQSDATGQRCTVIRLGPLVRTAKLQASSAYARTGLAWSVSNTGMRRFNLYEPENEKDCSPEREKRVFEVTAVDGQDRFPAKRQNKH